MKLHRHFYIAAALLACSAVLAQVYFHWLVKLGVGESVPLSKPLSSIPQELGNWKGVDVPIDPFIKQKIAAEDTLRRFYKLGTQNMLNMYIAYFGGVRGTAPHHPDLCRPGAGWKLISTEIVEKTLPGFGNEPLQVHQDVYEKNFDKEMVIWWEYIHGENVANRMWQRLKWALPGFMGGKRGAVIQVQLSMRFYGDADIPVKSIEEFMNDLGPHLESVLPGEHGAGNEDVPTRRDGVLH